MKTKTYILLFPIIIISIFSCNQTKQNIKNYIAFDPKYDEKTDSILSILTLEEKVALFHGNSFFSSTGLDRLGISELKYTDGPLGVREEVSRNSWAAAGWNNDSALFFPAGGALAATWNTELSELYGAAMGQEARARDKDILLAPAINIIRSPLCGRNFEYLSEDPYLIRTMVAPLIKGVQKQDVGVCVKHYAINNQETRREDVNSIADERTIREIYLPGFKASVDAGAYSFMGAYNKFRGHSLCENEYMINKILKGEWGFKGILVSDWSAVHSTVKSAINGLDVEMGSGDKYNEYFMADPLIKAVKEGHVSMDVIDEKARRIINVMLNLKKEDPKRKKGSINTTEHSDVIYKVASEAIVLLKNKNGILPVNMENINSIAIIGENAQRKHASGGFGAGVKAKYETTALESFRDKYGDVINITFAQGYKEQYIEDKGIRKFQQEIDHQPDQDLINEAVLVAESSDIAIIVAGSTRDVETESMDRKDLRLPFGQAELIEAVTRANPNTIVVIVAGAPFDVNKIKEISPAILWSWFNGSEAGNALVDVISGKVNPSGKLPFTIPVKLKDSPAHALNAFPGNDSVVYKEGILVGYRWFDTKKIEPAYCFGYGLSYTEFDFTDIKTNKSTYQKNENINISLTIKNMGKFAGKETVQIYVSKDQSYIDRAKKELKGYEKVLLEVGQKKNININIPVNDLTFFNEKTMMWEIENGGYEILVGSSSKNILKTCQIEIK